MARALIHRRVNVATRTSSVSSLSSSSTNATNADRLTIEVASGGVGQEIRFQVVAINAAVQPRVAIVTGGAGGLGRAMVERFTADGLQVGVADIDARGRVEGGDQVVAVDLDVTSPESAEAMVSVVLERYGRLDVLVNNAGIAGPTATVAEYPVADWHRVLEVNLFGAFHCTRACLAALQQGTDPRVVNIASVAGRDPNPEMSAYSASKAG